MQSEIEKLNLLVEQFNRLFLESEHTRLQPGVDEPFYKAPVGDQPAVIFSRENYFSSALHEIAHWCIAGPERRKIDDFGYWYKPEGRSQQEQAEFEQVEVKPQAIEWALSLACNHQFNFSADNLSQDIQASPQFVESVSKTLQEYLQEASWPPRAALLIDSLCQVFRSGKAVELTHV